MEKLLTDYFWILIILFIWTLPWKGAALWKSARRGDAGWFIAMLVLNTLAIVEILYLFVFSKEKPKQTEEKEEVGIEVDPIEVEIEKEREKNLPKIV